MILPLSNTNLTVWTLGHQAQIFCLPLSHPCDRCSFDTTVDYEHLSRVNYVYVQKDDARLKSSAKLSGSNARLRSQRVESRRVWVSPSLTLRLSVYRAIYIIPVWEILFAHCGEEYIVRIVRVREDNISYIVRILSDLSQCTCRSIWLPGTLYNLQIQKQTNKCEWITSRNNSIRAKHNPAAWFSATLVHILF